MLVTGREHPKNTDKAEQKKASFKPFFPMGTVLAQGWFYKSQALYLGGYSMGTFSLASLYAEHLMWRNRWSQSNCGFDLASYKGTKLYFQPHPELDYIVYVDEEYKSFAEWAKQCMHPGVLMTHPKARLIRSIKNGGPRRKLPRMFIKPPSTMNTGWQWMNTIATAGLFAWFTTWVDLQSPWIGNVDDPNTVKWWESGTADHPPQWVNSAILMQGKDCSKAENDYYAGFQPNQTLNQYNQLDFGPFIIKAPSHDMSKRPVAYPQMLWFYKSYWQWGGSTTGIKNVCDPKLEIDGKNYREKYKTYADGNEHWIQT